MEEEDFDEIPDEVLHEAEEATKKLIPEKSRDRYEKELAFFNQWRERKNVRNSLNENVVLAYFSGLASSFKASSLWTKYSMLKKELMIYHNVDISRSVLC